jgi:hypothetical protein
MDLTKQAAWVQCPYCELFWCNLHQMHAADCDCPPIEQWAHDPYAPRPPKESE